MRYCLVHGKIFKIVIIFSSSLLGSQLLYYRVPSISSLVCLGTCCQLVLHPLIFACLSSAILLLYAHLIPYVFVPHSFAFLLSCIASTFLFYLLLLVSSECLQLICFQNLQCHVLFLLLMLILATIISNF